AEDGIRDYKVTGVQTCALPIWAALFEWANQAHSPSVDRLVAVLALNSETGDLGRLLSDEARSIRRSVQRRTVEMMDRRSQQVWEIGRASCRERVEVAGGEGS